MQCRLKDITDLFLDTGIGADSYSIIELRMIEEIIANKENSRRNLFEEASGISKYKLRKKQTFTKLKDTETDLERVDDLLFEIEKELKNIREPAKKTERYYRLKEQYKALSINLASFKIKTLSETLARIEDREQQHTIDKTAVLTNIDKAEAALQQQKLESVIKEKNLSFQQKTTNGYVNKINAYESEKKLKYEQLKFLQDKEARLNAAITNDGTQLSHVHYNLKRLSGEKKTEDEAFENIKQGLALLKTAVDELRAQQTKARNEITVLADTTTKFQREIYKAEKELDIFNIQRQALNRKAHVTCRMQPEGRQIFQTLIR